MSAFLEPISYFWWLITGLCLASSPCFVFMHLVQEGCFSIHHLRGWLLFGLSWVAYSPLAAWPHGSIREVPYKQLEPSRLKEALPRFLGNSTLPPLSHQRRLRAAQQTTVNSRMKPTCWKSEENKLTRNSVTAGPCVSHILCVDKSPGILGLSNMVFDNTENPNRHSHLEPNIIFSPPHLKVRTIPFIFKNCWEDLKRLLESNDMET